MRKAHHNALASHPKHMTHTPLAASTSQCLPPASPPTTCSCVTGCVTVAMPACHCCRACSLIPSVSAHTSTSWLTGAEGGVRGARRAANAPRRAMLVSSGTAASATTSTAGVLVCVLLLLLLSVLSCALSKLLLGLGLLLFLRLLVSAVLLLLLAGLSAALVLAARGSRGGTCRGNKNTEDKQTGST